MSILLAVLVCITLNRQFCTRKVTVPESRFILSSCSTSIVFAHSPAISEYEAKGAGLGRAGSDLEERQVSAAQAHVTTGHKSDCCYWEFSSTNCEMSADSLV